MDTLDEHVCRLGRVLWTDAHTPTPTKEHTLTSVESGFICTDTKPPLLHYYYYYCDWSAFIYLGAVSNKFCFSCKIFSFSLLKD